VFGVEIMYLTHEYEKNIPDIIKKALKLCSEAAEEKGLQFFLIGGIVRDIIINKKNFDVDITVQGNAVEFAQYLEKNYSESYKIKETHESFKTAKILFSFENEIVALDLSSTRKESYPYPSSLPKIEEIGCELYEDVIRRDFTINSMALSLNKDNFCELIDYLGGYNDLKEGKLEVMHDRSFIDDPTRIIRGLKFSVRFGYKFGEKTEKLMRECLESGQFDGLAGERIKLELKQAFNVNRPECLTRFVKEDIYRLVDTELSLPENIDTLAVDSHKFISEYLHLIKKPDNIWLIYLGALLVYCVPGKITNMAENMDLDGDEENLCILKLMTHCCRKKIRDVSEKLYLSGLETNILKQASALCKKQEELRDSPSRFEVYEFFEKAPVESILLFLIKNKGLKDKVDLYFNELKDIKISIDGNKLIEMGLKPGPKFGEILRKVLKARVDREITSPEEEEKVVKSALKSD